MVLKKLVHILWKLWRKKRTWWKVDFKKRTCTWHTFTQYNILVFDVKNCLEWWMYVLYYTFESVIHFLDDCWIIDDIDKCTHSLCVIFTILVSFSRDNAWFASKAKIKVVWYFFEQSGPEGASRVRKNFKQLWFKSLM